jgi:hypothetical protein
MVLLLILASAAVADAAAPAAAEAAPTAEAGATSAPLVIDRPEMPFPNTNHYKCYPVLESTPFEPRRVGLRDQFVFVWVWVLRPRYLCNPTYKILEDGTIFPPVDFEAHQVCYEIVEDVPTGEWKVETFDQFGPLTLKGKRAELLCLPAFKRLIGLEPPPTTGG